MSSIGLAVLILALDTSSRAGSLAIVRNGEVVAERSGDPSRTHAERLPLAFADVCRTAGIQLRDVDLFAVAAGPGSFTGLRVGIAAIQGLAFALDRRVVAVSSLEAVAAAAPGAALIGAWVDAQRGEVFAQLFTVPVPCTQPSAIRHPLTTPISAAPDIVLARWQADAALDTVAFHGDGAVRYTQRIRTAAGPAAHVAATAVPLAGVIGRIAATQPERAVVPHAIAPVYVRKPDAELARDRRQGSI